jgi:hypothetical protein
MSESTIKLTGNNCNNNVGLSIGATICILLATLAIIIASIMMILQRKCLELWQIKQFTGDKVAEDNHNIMNKKLVLNNHNNVMAVETMGAKVVMGNMTAMGVAIGGLDYVNFSNP